MTPEATAAPRTSPAPAPAPRWPLAALLVMGLLAAPAGARVQPRLLDWQARLSRLIPRRVQVRVAEVADRLPVTATPGDLQEALVALRGAPSGFGPGLPPEPLELFGGIRLLLRRDQTLERYDQRVALYDASLRLLAAYRREVNEALRLAPPGPPGPALPGVEEGLPAPEVRPEGVHVLRLLPAPRPGTSRERLRLYLGAADQDTAALAPRREEADRGRAAFRETTLAWRWHLRHLGDRLDPLSGMPAHPVESGTPGAEPPVEQIPPPPPLDLPELRED